MIIAMSKNRLSILTKVLILLPSAILLFYNFEYAMIYVIIAFIIIALMELFRSKNSGRTQEEKE